MYPLDRSYTVKRTVPPWPAAPRAGLAFIPWLSCVFSSDPEQVAKDYLVRDPYTYEHIEAVLKCGRRDPNDYGRKNLDDLTKQGPSNSDEYTAIIQGTDMLWKEVADLAIDKTTENRAIVQLNGNWCYTGNFKRYEIATGQLVTLVGVTTIMDPNFDAIVTTYPGKDYWQ